MMQLLPLEGHWLEKGWKYVKPYAEKMAKRWDDEWPFEVIRRAAMLEELLLWLIWDDEAKKPMGCVGTQIIKKASGKRVLDIAWIAGEEREKWLHLIDELERYGAAHGCVESDYIGRGGWIPSLPGYKTTKLVRYTKELTNGSEQSEQAPPRPEGRDGDSPGGQPGAVGTGSGSVTEHSGGGGEPVPIRRRHSAS